MIKGPNVNSANDAGAMSPEKSASPFSPTELGYKGGLFSFGKNEEKGVRFTGERARASLTEPPTGYQTPSPDQPYGAGKAKAASNTTEDYLLNHGLPKDAR
jgi:hypothetical protein